MILPDFIKDTPQEWESTIKSIERETDPEYQEYLRLKEKFDK